MVLQITRHMLFAGITTLQLKAAFKILEVRDDFDNPELIVLEDISAYNQENVKILVVSEGETIYEEDIAYLGSLTLHDSVRWVFRVLS